MKLFGYSIAGRISYVCKTVTALRILRRNGQLTSSFCMISQTRYKILNNNRTKRSYGGQHYWFNIDICKADYCFNIEHVTNRVANCYFFHVNCSISSVYMRTAGCKKWIPFNYGGFKNLWTMRMILCSLRPVFVNEETNLIISYWNSWPSRPDSIVWCGCWSLFLSQILSISIF